MEKQYFHVIGVGGSEDWEAGHGSAYYIEDNNGEKAVPVFTTLKKAEQYIDANFGTPKAYMEMLESVPLSHLGALAEGDFTIMSFEAEEVMRWALSINAHYLIRDPRPGTKQEILRLD